MRKLYTLFMILALTTATAYAAVKTTKHTIKNGETLYTIAHKNHTTIEEVRKVNGLKRGDTLKLGRVLKVPKNTYFPNKKKKVTLKKSKKKKVAKKTKKTKKKIVKKSSKRNKSKLSKYRIKKGDTLSSIARKHHTTVSKILASNHMKKSQTLKLGKTLKVPTIKKASSKRVRFTKAKKKKSNKKLVASISRLDSVKLNKKVAKKSTKKKSTFSLGDIFFGSSKRSNKSTKITSLAKKKLGRRYVWGATGAKNTFDCSGFTTYVYKKNGIKLPRRAIAQSKYGKYVSRKNLKKGDLIFFDTSKRRRGYVNHVGIYLGNGKFIHASSAKKKVVITRLSNFYAKRYKGARRPS
jgi:cell wall-associated NlpC family hydrolase